MLIIFFTKIMIDYSEMFMITLNNIAVKLT